MNEFERCLKNRRILIIEPTREMLQKEMENAKYDLSKADDSLLSEDFKWSSVQAYYSMFHSAKALVLKKGYREKSHLCLLVALKELYIKSGDLDTDIAEDFEMCMNVRHEADYGMVYRKESAALSIEAARRLFELATEILKLE